MGQRGDNEVCCAALPSGWMDTTGEIPLGAAVAQAWPKGGICQLRLLVRQYSEALPALTDEYLVIR